MVNAQASAQRVLANYLFTRPASSPTLVRHGTAGRLLGPYHQDDMGAHTERGPDMR